MKRRIIKQGAATLTVSLPSSWTKKFSLEAKDEINVEEVGKNLLLSTKKPFKKEKAVLEVSALQRKLLYRYINAFYISGIEEIELLFSDPKKMELIQDISGSLIGLTVISQTKKSCIIRDIADLKENEFDNLLRRAFFMIFQLTEDCLNGIENKDKALLESLESRDWAINKILYACLRILSRKGYRDFDKTTYIHSIIWNVENISDSYIDISRDWSANKKITAMIKRTNSLLRDVHDNYYKFSNESALKIYQKRNEIKEEMGRLLKTNSVAEIRILFHIKKIVEFLVDVLQLELIINQSKSHSEPNI
ncbi:MAG: hypothetical protein Q7J54_05210 [Candidatus Woesearchaeota archaeon]|nr:hypothetical protein [Candidatus Woesearchaeota archaeon]